MLQPWLVVPIALAYVGLLFAIAYYGDLRARVQRPSSRPLVYSLSFGIFCTSWGFFGTVGQAASTGWVLAPPLGSVLLMVPSYVGPYLLFLFGWRFLEKLVRVGKQQQITSIADFISARYGKSHALGALVAVMAVIGIIPYIGLQLKSISWTYQILTASGPAPSGAVPWLQDTALYVALLMALFSILFGVRHIDATEHHEGMMLAIAFESVVKLVAFLAVGGFITYGIFDGFADLAERIEARPPPLDGVGNSTAAYFTAVVLSAVVIFTLPRQFHAAVVEAANPRDVRVARWLFPLFLLGMSVFVWPVAVAGLLFFGPDGVDPDTYMMTLPMAAGRPDMALLAFIGGFSAGTSMVIVATVALGIMICNDVIMPLLLRWRGWTLSRRQDLSGLVLWIRRGAITLILLAGYGYYRLTAEYAALAASGTLAFAAVAQFAPAVVGGLYWQRASKRGALIGLSVGFALWGYTLLLPMLASAQLVSKELLEYGPYGIDWLRPVALFGLEGLDTATHGTLWSLLANLFCYVWFSLGGQRRLIERSQAAAFVERAGGIDGHDLSARSYVTVEELQVLAERFLGPERADAVFAAYAESRGRELLPLERADHQLLERLERVLAGVIGASSARVVLSSALRGRDLRLEEVAAVVGGASQMLQFNRELLAVTIESVPQGISVVDSELRLVAWNSRFLELFGYPEGFIKVGRRIAEVIRYNAERGEYGPVKDEADIRHYVSRVMTILRRHEPYVVERKRLDGTVLEVRGNPLPGGGFVTTYLDVTQYKRTEEALRESEQSVRVFTDNVPVLIAYIDRDQRYRFVNRAYEQLLRLPREAILGRRTDEVLPSDYLRARARHSQAVLMGQPQRFEVDLPAADGGVRHASATYIPDFNVRGEVVGFFALFHDVTERVEAERALQEAKATLERRVEERTQALREANEALRRAKQEAERANLSKTRFLAAASHDLLQPLNAAGLFCSALAQRLQDPDDRNLARNIESSLKSAEALLSELLDISKLDAGALKPQLSDFALDELLRELSVEFTALARHRGLSFDMVPCRCVVRSDRQLLRRVLQNFLSNAIRYTPQGRVLLGCRRIGDEIRIEVWDTGPGISEDQLGVIFEEFQRLGHYDYQGEKCLGLGLAIADRIVRMLGHRLSVRSWVGRGSVFSVQVPRGQAAVREEPPPAPVTGALHGLCVLCVDNEPSIVEGMRNLLAGWGCRVLTATDLDSAMAAVEASEEGVDAMLVDYRLDQDANGIDLMDAVRARVGQAVPGVLITADYREAIRAAARERGYQFLNKPVKPAALRAVLSQFRRLAVDAAG